MTRTYASAGAVVVSPDVMEPKMLLLEQIRKTGERQVVAPKGRIELGESPLITGAREVAEESGLGEVMYVAYLGQLTYSFTDNDGTPAEKTVDWFLFAANDMATVAQEAEGFVGARWFGLNEAMAAATHSSFRDYMK